MKNISLVALISLLVSSCISKKEHAMLQSKYDQTNVELVAVKNSLTKCIIDREKCTANTKNLNNTIADLKNDKKKTLEYVDNLTVLSQGANDNIKETLTQLSKKDAYINKIRAAATKKDSLNLVVAFHLKKELQEGIDDEDIEINVEKTVVFISISDKLLFKSGSYSVTEKAYSVLEKVATVINSQPDMDVMVEGHTDSTPIKNTIIQDNWDLSVKRATAVVRILQNDFDVAPARMTAAGRSYYMPVADNDTASNRAKNRRTRIVVLPKLDQFYDLIAQGMN